MKLGSTLLAFTSLLLMGSLASATSTPEVSPSGEGAIMTPAEASPGCPGAELSFLNPAPSENAIPCGACSQPICQGKARGAVCKFQGGQWYYCQPVYGELCPGTMTWDCTCWTGPLP